MFGNKLTGKSNYIQKGKDNQVYSTMNVLKELQVDFGCCVGMLNEARIIINS